eukprot:TRINITY_DN44076_c0_g1_i1.p1 TRINITY_DN44076_c0_g1~~TRINITY_DN44076_c0_g1_i1.p1  ORF type:complete len:554 (-),score=65.29 TRINITY_DN44076_c0_g1_i1:96-1757(-)
MADFLLRSGVWSSSAPDEGPGVVHGSAGLVLDSRDKQVNCQTSNVLTGSSMRRVLLSSRNSGSEKDDCNSESKRARFGDALPSSNGMGGREFTWQYAVHENACAKGEQWVQFTSEDSHALETHYKRWIASCHRKDVGEQVPACIGTQFYLLNFADMIQTNPTTGQKHRLKRVLSPVGHAAAEPGELDKLQKALQDAQAQVTLAHSEIVKLRSELRDTRSAASTARSEAASLRAKLAEATLAGGAARLEIMQARREVDDMRSAASTARSEASEVRAELEEMRKLKATMRDKLDIDIADVDNCQASLEEMEIWKQQGTHFDPMLFDKTDFTSRLQTGLRGLVSPTHFGDCSKARLATVTSVRAVVNIRLWKQYVAKRHLVVETLRTRKTCPWAKSLTPPVNRVANVFPWISLDERGNEVLLLHGTSIDIAEKIAKQGFDERLCQRGLYGRGIYLTTDFCKAMQYGGDGPTKCLIVTRAILGHPFEARGPLQSCERPPEVDGLGFPHDSTVAKPGIPKGHRKGAGKIYGQQLHYEFIVARGDLQLYPEFIVVFDVP